MNNSFLMNGLSGELTREGHRLMVRVYFEDTDFSGVVYHARYLHFFERGRSDFLRLKGIHHHELKAGHLGESIFFVVKSMALDFKTPAQIDDVLIVETLIARQVGARIIMRQCLLRGQDIIATADVTVVLVNEQGKPRRLPRAVVDALSL